MSRHRRCAEDFVQRVRLSHCCSATILVQHMMDADSQDLLKAVFMQFDQDGSGSISPSELQSLLSAMGSHFTTVRSVR